jgi:CBS domain-containing protein/hemerythrin-like domain-containing protein
METCRSLQCDHAAIGEVLRAADAVLRAPADGGDVVLPGMVEFFGAFVERCHEAKEEQALLPVLANRGVLDADAMRTVQHDHREANRLLQELRRFATRRRIDPEVGNLLASYVALQRHHMAFEDVSVFPLAEKALSSEEDVDVREAFDRIEERVLGRGGRDVLLALAGALTECARTLGLDRRAGVPSLVSDILRPGSATVAPGDSLARARELMTSLGTRELPVVDGGALVGILTRTDMEPHQGHLEWTPVRVAMNPHPVVVAPNAAIRDVARLLLDHGFNSVPVSNGKLLGMIRRIDLLEVLAAGNAR